MNHGVEMVLTGGKAVHRHHIGRGFDSHRLHMMNTPIFLTGRYDTIAGSDALNAYIKSFWKSHYGIDLLMGRYNSFPPYPETGALVIIGHSWGGDAAVKWAAELSPRPVYLVLIDPVSNGSITPFVLSSNVKRATAYYRACNGNGSPVTESVPASIVLRGSQDINITYKPRVVINPDGTENYAAEHGQYVWEASTSNVVRSFITQANSDIWIPSAPPVPVVPLTLESLAARVAALEAKYEQVK